MTPVFASHIHVAVACLMLLVATTAAERTVDAVWCIGSADSMTNVLRSSELQVSASSVAAYALQGCRSAPLLD